LSLSIAPLPAVQIGQGLPRNGPIRSADDTTYPKLQILTIQQILGVKQPEYPLHRRDATFKKAPAAVLPQPKTYPLPCAFSHSSASASTRAGVNRRPAHF
jgi:hypothetical protein